MKKLTLSVYHHIGILVAKANGKRFGRDIVFRFIYD
jgi:hypothetical protein